MYRFKVRKLVAAAVAEIESEAVTRWHNEKCRREPIELALSTQVREMHTTVIRRSQGNISVTVSMLCRQPWDSETYWFPLQIRGNSVVRPDRELST